MSTFVLKKEYALQLPNSYVDIDRDEMEYVDGGAEKIDYWWGWAMNLNSSECGTMAKLIEFNIAAGGTIGGLGAAIAGAFPMIGGATAIAAGIYSINIWYVKSVLQGAHDSGKNATLSKTMVGYTINVW